VELSIQQFELVSNMFSFTIAAMGATALFCYFTSFQIHPKYRVAVLVSAVVVSIACYHYVRIHDSWHEAYAISGAEAGAVYQPTNIPFNDAYRYVDWILTVPLLVIELIAVMALPRALSSSLTWRLGGSAALMIALGYPGEIAESTGTRWLFWGLSMIPFLYILFVLLTELSSSLERQPEPVRNRISVARYIIVVTWLFYPIAYLAPMIGLGGAQAEVALQVGYSIADVLAKAAFGLYIYSIAATKSELETGVSATLNREVAHA
jgi:bacteriorhodopsin